MEEMGVISKVDEPTEWCAGMVAIPKKSGANQNLRGSEATEFQCPEGNTSPTKGG